MMGILDKRANFVDLSRTRRLRVDMEVFLQFFYQQSRLPAFVDFPRCKLPSDFIVVAIDRKWPPSVLEVVIYSATFEPIPNGEELPLLMGIDTYWETYALATQEDVDNRALRYVGEARSPILPPVSVKAAP